MLFSFNSLPPATKKAAEEVYSIMQQETSLKNVLPSQYQKLNNPDARMIFIDLVAHYYLPTYPANAWIEIIAAYGLINDEVKNEMFPYIFGAK